MQNQGTLSGSSVKVAEIMGFIYVFILTDDTFVFSTLPVICL